MTSIEELMVQKDGVKRSEKTKALRFWMDKDRRRIEDAAANRDSIVYPKEIRRRFLQSRRDLAFIPKFGPNGAVLEILAKSTGRPRQRIDQILYPKSSNLFSTENLSIKEVWMGLLEFTGDHEHLYNKDGSDGPFKMFFKLVLSGKPVKMQVNTMEHKFLTKRLQEFGSVSRVDTDKSTSPTTYVYHPSNRVFDDDGVPLDEPVWV